MTLRAILSAALSCVLLSTVAVAADRGTAEEAIALWNKGKAYFDKNGAEATMTAITKDPSFVDRDLYLFCYDTNNRVVAHGGNAKMIGLDANQFRDSDGKAFVPDIVRIAHSGTNGWVDYKWADTIAKKIMQKSTYVGAYGEYACAVGTYK